MYGTGFLPTEESNLYRLEKDDLYLTGTSEVALAGIHTDERLEEPQLPARYAAFSTNFRREAGAAGKDTRGMFRVHQFDKVEMYVYCVPEQSREIHDQLLAHEEEIVQELGLPYRVRTSRSATSAARRPRSTTSRRGSRPSSATARSRPARTPPTTRPGG